MSESLRPWDDKRLTSRAKRPASSRNKPNSGRGYPASIVTSDRETTNLTGTVPPFASRLVNLHSIVGLRLTSSQNLCMSRERRPPRPAPERAELLVPRRTGLVEQLLTSESLR